MRMRMSYRKTFSVLLNFWRKEIIQSFVIMVQQMTAISDIFYR